MVKNPSANTGDIKDTGSIPGLGRSPGGGHATHFLPGESSWIEEPGRLQSIWLKETDGTEVTYAHTLIDQLTLKEGKKVRGPNCLGGFDLVSE